LSQLSTDEQIDYKFKITWKICKHVFLGCSHSGPLWAGLKCIFYPCSRTQNKKERWHRKYLFPFLLKLTAFAWILYVSLTGLQYKLKSPNLHIEVNSQTTRIYRSSIRSIRDSVRKILKLFRKTIWYSKNFWTLLKSQCHPTLPHFNLKIPLKWQLCYTCITWY
jgi:hypothetical protein